MLPEFDGAEKHFKDWFIKIRNFVQHHLHFEDFLNWVMELEEEPTVEVLLAKDEAERRGFPGVDLLWYDQQLYSLLVLLCKGDALSMARSVEDDTVVRGARSWYRITRDVAGKSGLAIELTGETQAFSMAWAVAVDTESWG